MRKTLLCFALLAGVTGCDSSNDSDEVGRTPSPTLPSMEDPQQEQPHAQSWQCPENPGSAPSGELVAEVVPGTESQRDAPGLYEGPVWLHESLFYSDFTFEDGFPSQIQRLTRGSNAATAVPNSGTNGLALDGEGYLLAASHDPKEIARIDPYTGQRETIVSEYQGNPFNSPNDLTMSDDGVIYFTDPDFQRSAGPGGQPETRVYRVEDQEVTAVDDTLANPNGIALSPDEDRLYVAGGGEAGVLRMYPIVDGVPGEGEDLAEVTIPDGMAVDCLGNIYATEHAAQRIRVFSPEGEELAKIQLDANVTNATFGGPDLTTLYITGAGRVWRVPLDVAGLPD